MGMKEVFPGTSRSVGVRWGSSIGDSKDCSGSVARIGELRWGWFVWRARRVHSHFFCLAELTLLFLWKTCSERRVRGSDPTPTAPPLPRAEFGSVSLPLRTSQPSKNTSIRLSSYSIASAPSSGVGCRLDSRPSPFFPARPSRFGEERERMSFEKEKCACTKGRFSSRLPLSRRSHIQPFAYVPSLALSFLPHASPPSLPQKNIPPHTLTQR